MISTMPVAPSAEPTTASVSAAASATATTAVVFPTVNRASASLATPLEATHDTLWPLIWANLTGAPLDEEQSCVATAIYFEARGEPFDGQLAVAEVIMNRARSGRYPTTYCSVVKQPWQFSFVRAGRFPAVNTSSASWSYAQAITRIASKRLASALPHDVLWYHADYVAPTWGRRLSRVNKIGAHIFYRA